LELEQQRNRIVAELTNDIIFEYDYDTDEMTCSERYETIFHKPRVIPNYRRHQDNLLNMLLPEDAKTLQEAYRRIEQGIDSYALPLRLRHQQHHAQQPRQCCRRCRQPRQQ